MNVPSARILIVDDEFSVRDSLQHWFLQDGHLVEVAENATEALRLLQDGKFEVALLDIKMPGMDGMELLERLRQIDERLSVIMITAFASVETAVRALKLGAFDYVTKPIDPDELSHLVTRALDNRRLVDENTQLKKTLDEVASPEAIVGESPAIRRVMELVHHVAATDATVLVRGPSGTGKELVARAIHAESPRRYFPIIAVNCGAIPEGLLESELFGHEKGAFTGAQYRRKGKFEMADGGTLFLDEIGAIPLRMQVDLLRILESHEVVRVGGSRPMKLDFRVVCATNEDLEEAIREGRFREDLYYRINVFTIEVPPLVDRRVDVPLLANHFLAQLGRQMGKRFSGFEEAALDLLEAHDWPGNVRELANAVERAVVVGKPPRIRARDLPRLSRRPTPSGTNESLADIEKRHVLGVLQRTGWNVSQTARILRVDRVTVYNKIKKYDLQRESPKGL